MIQYHFIVKNCAFMHCILGNVITPHEAYTHYLVVARGKRKKTDTDDKILCILETELTYKAFGRNWARFIYNKITRPIPSYAQSVPVQCGSLHSLRARM
jgi:hypothetical protein